MNVLIAEKALQHAAKDSPGLSREELIVRVPRAVRFDAVACFNRAITDGLLVEVAGRFYTPSAAAAKAALRS